MRAILQGVVTNPDNGYSALALIKEDGSEKRQYVFDPTVLAQARLVPAGSTVEVTYVKKDDGNFTVTAVTAVDPNSPKPTKSGGSWQAKKGGTTTVKDPKQQQSITFQNSLRHATTLAIHNSGGATVSVETVLAIAHQLYTVSIDPEKTTTTTTTNSTVSVAAVPTTTAPTSTAIVW